MPRRDPSQTDASGLEPTEVGGVSQDQDTQDALTRVHGNTSGRSHASQRASQRLASVGSAHLPPQPSASARHRISSGSTRTALSAQVPSSSGRIPTASRRMPAAQFLGGGSSHGGSRGSKRLLLAVLLGILGPVTIIIGLVWFMRPDELSVRAGKALTDGERQVVLVRDALAAKRAVDAKRAIEQGRTIIDVPTPGDAALAEKLKVLGTQFQALLVEAERVERDMKVQQNLDRLHTQFVRLNSLDAAGLDTLEKQGLAFIANPVTPGAEADPVAIEAYRVQVDDIRRALDTIKPARQRLETARTAVQEAKARSEVAELVRGERFQAALDLIAGYRQQYPTGRFDEHHSFAENAAKRTWEAVKVYAESRIQDARQPGLPAAKRKQVVSEARKRLNEAIARFGIPEQVDAAKALLQQLPAE